MRAPARSRLPALIGLLLAGSALLVAFGVLALSDGKLPGQAKELRGRAETARVFGGLRQSGASLGSEDAPLTISLFVDIQCRRCAAWWRRVVPPLVESYVRSDRARIVLHHVSVGAHDTSIAANAAVAAGEQAREWQFSHLFVRNQGLVGERGIDDRLLERIARAVSGLELGGWRSEREDDSVARRLEADDILAAELGLPAAPAITLAAGSRSRKLADEPGLAEIRRAIGSLLRRSGAPLR